MKRTDILQWKELTSDLLGDRQQAVMSSWYYPLFLCVGDILSHKMWSTELWIVMKPMDCTNYHEYVLVVNI